MNLGGHPTSTGCVPMLGPPFQSPPPGMQKMKVVHRRVGSKAATFMTISTTPWILPGSRRLPGVLGLHQEIEDFYTWMLPTTLEHNLRLDVVERIRAAINDLYPAARVEISGSFRTGLYLPTSDIDLVICGKWESLPLRTIERILLEKKIASPDSLRVLDKAAVPIVKLTDIRSDIKVDISFNMSNGVRAAELIKHFKKRYPSLPKLIYVLKQFLLQRDLNEVFTGGLSSYSLILLVISYLQHHYSPETASSGNANLGVMLIEILELYGRNFNFMNSAIRITDGGSYISKIKFQKVIANGYAPALLSIEDPLDPTNDVGRSSYGFVAVQNSFDRAFALLTSLVVAQTSHPDGKSILSSIVEIPEEVSEYRIWMRDQFPFLGSPHNYMIPAVPLHYVRAPLEFVTPRELPPSVRFASAKEKVKVCSLHHLHRPSAVGSPPAVNNNGNDLSDCLSNVSSGTCPSQSSPLDSLSDTDSDVLPTMTPYSAMSISPANSEIGGSSIGGSSLQQQLTREAPKRTNKESGRCPSSSSSSNSSRGSSSGRQPIVLVQQNTGGAKHRPNPNPSLRSSSKHHSSPKDRSDSVLNWRRSPERRKKVYSSNSSALPVEEVDPQPQPQQRQGAENTTNSSTTSFNDESSPQSNNNNSTSFTTSSSKSLVCLLPPAAKGPSSSEGRADRDSNWRERDAAGGGCNSIAAAEHQEENSSSSAPHQHTSMISHPPASSSSLVPVVVAGASSITTSSSPPNHHHFSVSSNNGTLVKTKKKHKKNNQNKSSFKYPTNTTTSSPSQKVIKESEKYIESSRDSSTSYREGSSSKDSSRVIIKSSLKKRKKSSHHNKPGDESGGVCSSNNPPPKAANTSTSSTPPPQCNNDSSSSRFSPKARLGHGKR